MRDELTAEGRSQWARGVEWGFLILIPILILIQGCSSPDPTRKPLAEAQQMAADPNIPDELRPYYQRIYWEGESQATLNRMRLASVAMETGHWSNAERALDEVIPEIEALGPADPRSRNAMSEFHPEDIKKFKGEPYERAMAYFLRGLLYIRIQDWSNARACFKSVPIQDVGGVQRPGEKAIPQAPQGNWAGADWLEGWCAFQMGEKSDARECWERARRGGMTPPAESDNLLGVALLGWGPVKTMEGKQGERLAYHRTPSRAVQVRLKPDYGRNPPGSGDSKTFVLAEDLFLQATGHGLRRMDIVNEEKAETKEGTQTAGSILTMGGAGATVVGAVGGDKKVAEAGLGALAAGLATSAVGSSISPQADTRVWDLLPERIALLPFSRTAATTAAFQFFDEKGGLVHEQKTEIKKTSQPQVILLFKR